MKTRSLVSILILVLSVLITVGSCATTKKAISDEEFFKVWSSTWINAENSMVGLKFRKAIFHPDGSYDQYYEIEDTIPHDTTKLTFNEKWTDSEGNIWYKAHWENNHYVEGYSIGKFSTSGNTYEEVCNFGDKPIEKWAPDDIRYYYWIWYRQ